MIRILPILRRHAEEIEVDFHHFYHLDIGGLWTGELTPRKVRVLIEGLRAYGHESLLVRGMAGDDPSLSWSTAEHLLASLVDAQREGNWLFLSAHRDPDAKMPPPPPPILRPGEERPEPEKPEFASVDEVASVLSAVNRA